MGEWAEMMLDGTLCQVCGVFMGGAGDGFPVTCAGCLAERRGGTLTKPKVKCPTCGKKVKAAGLADHNRDVHQQGTLKP